MKTLKKHRKKMSTHVNITMSKIMHTLIKVGVHTYATYTNCWTLSTSPYGVFILTCAVSFNLSNICKSFLLNPILLVQLCSLTTIACQNTWQHLWRTYMCFFSVFSSVQWLHLLLQSCLLLISVFYLLFVYPTFCCVQFHCYF